MLLSIITDVILSLPQPVITGLFIVLILIVYRIIYSSFSTTIKIIKRNNIYKCDVCHKNGSMVDYKKEIYSEERISIGKNYYDGEKSYRVYVPATKVKYKVTRKCNKCGSFKTSYVYETIEDKENMYSKKRKK